MKAVITFCLDATEEVEISLNELKLETPERRLQMLEQAFEDAINLYEPAAMFKCQGDCGEAIFIEEYHDECLVETGQLVCADCGYYALADFKREQS